MMTPMTGLCFLPVVAHELAVGFRRLITPAVCPSDFQTCSLRLARTLGLLLAITASTCFAQADSTTPYSAPAPTQLMQDFENSIADALLAHLDSEIAQLPNNGLNLEFLDIRAVEGKLRLLNQYQAQIHSVDKQYLDSNRLLRLKLLSYAHLMLQQRARFSSKDHAISPFHGPHTDLLRLLQSYPISPESGLEPLILQLNLLSRSLHQPFALQENMTEVECLTLQNQLQSLSKPTALSAGLHYRLTEMGLPSPTRRSYLDQFEASLEATILPALQEFSASINCVSRPTHQGTDSAYYRYRLARFSADEPSAELVHNLGLTELKRIQTALSAQWQHLYPARSAGVLYDEMRASQTLSSTLSDAKKQQYLSRVTDQILAIEAVAPAWVGAAGFTNLEIVAAGPLLSLYALPIEYQQPSDSLAQMLINFGEASPSEYQLAAQTYYHTIPGMHQVRLQPRRFSTLLSSADDPGYFSGWSLYLTNLALENPGSASLDSLGLVAMNAELAAMLVIDTGIHALNWSRQQAIDFLLANTPTPLSIAPRLIDEVRFRPAAMAAPYLGMLRAQRLVATHGAKHLNWQDLLVAGPVPVPLTNELSVWLNVD